MLARIESCGLIGLQGFSVWVEIDVTNGLPHLELVGLPDAAVRESRERVRSAIKNSGFLYPQGRITINLAPADFKKEGAIYDLPIAMAILAATGQMDPAALQGSVLLGELALDGSVRGVRGVLPMLIDAKERGIKRAFVPKDNGEEAAYVQGILTTPVESLKGLMQALQTGGNLSVLPQKKFTPENETDHLPDFRWIKGQESAKRAMEIAVAGGHNILLIGPPGSGKSMLAKAIPSILPPMTFEEALEVTKIHSVCGELTGGMIKTRPFRSPHHTASTAAITGGGANALPGEASLSHNGVLFLDELPEFRRDTLEALRQPLEDGKVSIARATAKMVYPARFMLVASMNPCPCGHYGDSDQECRCSPGQINRYLSKISGPLLDRIDLHIEVARPKYEEITQKKEGESSAEILKRVIQARNRQIQRFRALGIYTNSQMTAKEIETYCFLKKPAKQLLETAFHAMQLSARSYHRILMVARTIADLAGEEEITQQHIAEAVQYRSLDRKYWGGM